MTTKIIRDGAEAYQRWELPAVEAQTPSEAGRNGALGLVTADRLSKIQDQAFKEAQEQGFAQGYKDGVEKARQEFALRNDELNKRVGHFGQLLATLSRPLEQLDEQVERELAALAVALARQLIRREMKIDPGEIVPVVREAVAALPSATRRPQIYLHPEDAAFIRNTFSLNSETEHWKLIDDPSLTRGDCRVITENSRIDATVESRLAATIAQALGGEREEDRQHP